VLTGNACELIYVVLVSPQPGKCNVIMNCVEKGRLHLSGGSYVQGNEGAVGAALHEKTSS